MIKGAMDISNNISSCAVCQQISSKAILFVCESGHIMCPNCRSNNFNNEGGDCMKSANTHQKTSKKDKNKKKVLKSIKDLASGDYEKKNYNSIPEMTFMYRNIQYRNSSTSTNSSASDTDQPNGTLKRLQQFEEFSADRPVACPVCSKITAINSVLQHFQFDHSKIPRLTLTVNLLGHIVLKIPDLNTNTNCLAVLFTNDNNSAGTLFNSPALLMGAKIETPSIRFYKQNNEDKSILVHKPLRQEDKYEHFEHKSPTKTIKFQDNGDSNRLKARQAVTQGFNMLLWICKICDEDNIYNITVSTEDEKISYSYTGGAVHIRDKQDSRIMYHNPECLVLRGIAVNRLMNKDCQIQVFVKCVC